VRKLSEKFEQKPLNLIKHRTEGQTNDPFSSQLFTYFRVLSVIPEITTFRAVKLNSAKFLPIIIQEKR